MKVKLLVSRVGMAGAQDRGDVIEVPADEGRRMVAAGQAEVVRSKEPERAVRKSKAEKAAK